MVHVRSFYHLLLLSYSAHKNVSTDTQKHKDLHAHTACSGETKKKKLSTTSKLSSPLRQDNGEVIDYDDVREGNHDDNVMNQVHEERITPAVYPG